MKLRSPFLCLESGFCSDTISFLIQFLNFLGSVRIQFEGRFWVLFGYNFTAPMDVSAKLAALTSALGPYGHVRPGMAAETPGFAFYGAIGILVCD